MCMKGLTFLMWNFIMIYPLDLKKIRENLKISAITGRLPVCFFRFDKKDVTEHNDVIHDVKICKCENLKDQKL